MKIRDRIKLVTKALTYKGQSYDAARPSIARRWPYNASASDSHVDVGSGDRERLLKLSRWCYNNMPFYRGIVGEKSRYAVGNGIRPQARSGDEDWDAAAEAFFDQWSRVADITGRFTWREMQRLASIAIDRDGEVFFRMLTQATGYPAVQMILAHRIGNDKDSLYSPGDSSQKIIDGVVLNDAGRTIFYRYLTGPGTNPTAGFEDIPASQMVHLGEAAQGDELRYVTPVAPSLNHLQDVSAAIGFEKMALKVSSYVALAIKSSNPQGADFFGEATTSVDTTNNSEVTVESLGNTGGAIPRLGYGEDLVAWNSNRPSQNFREFCDILLREVCLNVGVPWEFASRPAEAGGAALRAVLVRAQRTFEQRQSLLIDRLCNRVWAHVVTIGMQRGLIPQNPNWYKVEWQRPAAASVDYGREAAANLNDVRVGLRTYAEDFSERGLEWKDALRQRASEAKFLQDLAEAYGVPQDTIATFNPNGPQQAPSESEPKEQAIPAPQACPTCTQSKQVNSDNHMRTIVDAALGPADPRQPSDAFWRAKVSKWGVAEGEARARLCLNCEHYIATSAMQKCISEGPGGKLKASELPVSPKWADIDGMPSAVCSRFNITCSALRTCDEWEPGGPITDGSGDALTSEAEA